MTAALRILSPGLLTTLQDAGRFGHQRLGIPVSGALDPISLHAANLLAGNEAHTAALEIAYQGPTLEVDAESVRIACAGATAAIDIVAGADGGRTRRLPMLQSALLRRGDTVRIGALTGGSVLYLAVEGGFDVAPVLGSRSTLVRAGIGGVEGRALIAGDRLPLSRPEASAGDEMMLPSLDLAPPPRFRIVPGPQDDYFTADALRTLTGSTYTVMPASDRMGMRLDGPRLDHAKGYNIVSDGIAPGTVQVPGNGLPIVLLADRQTTGGYPKIATVISADLPALGRLTPGAEVHFAAVSIEEAEALRRARAAELAGLAHRIVRVPPVSTVDESALHRANLVSGMVDALAGEGP